MGPVKVVVRGSTNTLSDADSKQMIEALKEIFEIIGVENLDSRIRVDIMSDRGMVDLDETLVVPQQMVEVHVNLGDELRMELEAEDRMFFDPFPLPGLSQTSPN
jgi:hypothetical protein